SSLTPCRRIAANSVQCRRAVVGPRHPQFVRQLMRAGFVKLVLTSSVSILGRGVAVSTLAGDPTYGSPFRSQGGTLCPQSRSTSLKTRTTRSVSEPPSALVVTSLRLQRALPPGQNKYTRKRSLVYRNWQVSASDC